jgi:class 3 adenylate cyclase/tetratricopeptide (TPR) repeat protein
MAAGNEPARDVRKVVTVVFCDLAGYTSTGDELDPEALRALQSRYFEGARAALERHGGTVEKFIGDAVMAVFGIPVLHEDDALRALRAAVELRESVVQLGLHARIGVNTGEVVAGTGDALVTGDAVNVAARLEQAAEAGEIILGDPTLQLARDAVEVEAVDPVAAKGKPELVPAHRLLRVVEGAPAFERRLDAPLVGRQEELAKVRSAFDAALADRSPRLVTAFGPPGIGKTRLAREVAASLEGDADVLVGRCLPYGEGITYWPLAEIFRQAQADDAWGTALAAGSPEDVAWEVRKWLEARSRARPQTIVFEDIHWAEPPLLDLIEHVADWSRDAPMLLLCLARPDLRAERAAWGGEAIMLEPLTAEESDELIESLLGEATVDDATRARVRNVAEGNPLFVEQLLAMIADGSAPDEVPATIQALLAARLDGLQEDERDIVERASVVGLDFEWEALAELALDGQRPPGSKLAALVRKELIRPHEAIDDTFRFRHMLIRDAAYDRIPKSERADLHERFAGWLEGRGEEFEEIIGYHLEQAHACLVELGRAPDRSQELARRAARFLAASGRRAFERGDLSAAADLLSRAVNLLAERDPNRLPLLPMLGRALTDRGEWERAKALLQEAIESGTPTVAADATVANLFLWLHSDPQASHAAMQPILEAAIGVFEEAGDLAGLANGLYLAGLMRFWRGDATDALEELERAAGHARDARDRTLEAEIYSSMLNVARHGPMRASELEVLVLELRRRVPLVPTGRRLEIRALSTLAYVAALRDDFETARHLNGGASNLARELGTQSFAMTEADVELLAGNWPAAERVLRAELEALEQIGDLGHYASLVLPFVDALIPQGRGEESRAAVELADRYAIDDDADAQIGINSSLSALQLLEGDLALAEAHAREAVAMAGRTEYTIHHIRALSGLGDVLVAKTELDGAQYVFGRAIELAREKESVAHERILRAKLAELSAQPPATA